MIPKCPLNLSTCPTISLSAPLHIFQLLLLLLSDTDLSRPHSHSSRRCTKGRPPLPERRLCWPSPRPPRPPPLKTVWGRITSTPLLPFPHRSPCPGYSLLSKAKLTSFGRIFCSVILWLALTLSALERTLADFMWKCSWRAYYVKGFVHRGTGCFCLRGVITGKKGRSTAWHVTDTTR